MEKKHWGEIGLEVIRSEVVGLKKISRIKEELFNIWGVPMKLLDTPKVLLDLDKLEKNMADMATFAQKAGVSFRPHVKSHKTPEIAWQQMELGAVGITVSKLGEAEVMARAGIKDLFIAYQLVGKQKMLRLQKLMQQSRVSVGIDSLTGASQLNEAGRSLQRPIPVLIEINSGLNRCGVLPGEETLKLARGLTEMPFLHLEGVFTHAGHVYAASPGEVAKIGRQEGESVAKAATLLRTSGIPVHTVSVGSTPTARVAGSFPGVTEIRPGNYVFYDAIQVGLGVASPEQCALSIEATVISRPAEGRAVIDAGSKVFSLDKGAHGQESVQGFGMIVGWPHLVLSRLSEEHGIIERVGEGGVLPDVGERLRVIPNHACPVVNLTDYLTLVRGEEVVGQWRVAARGRVD